MVAEEKDALIKSLTAKATEIAGLKASLVSDLSNLVGNLNGWKNKKRREKNIEEKTKTKFGLWIMKVEFYFYFTNWILQGYILNQFIVILQQIVPLWIHI